SAPHDLSRTVSAVTTPEQFEALVQRLWPKSDVKQAEAVMIRGLLTGVSGSPRFLSPAELQPVRQQEQGELYVGTGIQVAMDPAEKLVKIVVPFRRGPARRAGAKPNDLIVEVDGVNMAGRSLQQVVQAIRGKEGTPVTLAVRQPGSAEVRTLKMV